MRSVPLILNVFTLFLGKILEFFYQTLIFEFVLSSKTVWLKHCLLGKCLVSRINYKKIIVLWRTGLLMRHNFYLLLYLFRLRLFSNTNKMFLCAYVLCHIFHFIVCVYNFYTYAGKKICNLYYNIYLVL